MASIKKNTYNILIIFSQLIICSLVIFYPEGHLVFTLFCLYCFYKCDIFSYCEAKQFFEPLKSFIYFLPVLFFTLILSKHVLFEYSEQSIVIHSKSFTLENNFREIFSICIISPILEELFFRFIFYRTLKYFLGLFLAIFVTSFIFAIIHSNILAMPSLFILGFYLNFIFVRFQNILYPILLHIFFNTIMLIFIMIK